MATLIKSTGLQGQGEYDRFVRGFPVRKFRLSPHMYEGWISWGDWLGKPMLSESHPALVKEWHPTKNGTLTPDNVTYGSGQKVWWLGECGHEWQASIDSRHGGIRGCPYCSGRKASVENCLATVNPRLTSEWHPTKNGTLTPYDVSEGSNERVWWICGLGHEWDTMIVNRACGNRSDCPYCSGNKASKENCLATLNPKLAKEWYSAKNGTLNPKDVTACCHTKVWWKCKKGHAWEATVNNRNRGRNCPYCHGNKVCKDNCLATVKPKLVKEWHPTKNGTLTPNDVTPGMRRKVWWKCALDHEWEAAIISRGRNRGSGCPWCYKKDCETRRLKTEKRLLALTF